MVAPDCGSDGDWDTCCELELDLGADRYEGLVWVNNVWRLGQYCLTDLGGLVSPRRESNMCDI